MKLHVVAISILRNHGNVHTHIHVGICIKQQYPVKYMKYRILRYICYSTYYYNRVKGVLDNMDIRVKLHVLAYLCVFMAYMYDVISHISQYDMCILRYHDIHVIPDIM